MERRRVRGGRVPAHNTEPTYEVEPELVVDEGVYTSARDAGEIARGVEHKVKLLLGQPSQDIEVVDDPVRRSKRGERAHARAERARPRQARAELRRS